MVSSTTLWNESAPFSGTLTVARPRGRRRWRMPVAVVLLAVLLLGGSVVGIRLQASLEGELRILHGELAEQRSALAEREAAALTAADRLRAARGDRVALQQTLASTDGFLE